MRIGERFGPFEVLAKLGEGGMGEVYRARDTKLGRSVALKILPDVVAEDRERVARLGREAKVLASLNHPNIAALYGIEEVDRRQLLVMELVEGETLAERLQRGPLRIEEALPVATQICEALEAAHEQGIVHRDLKPANIKITPDERVKVLDFGLAKAIDRGPVIANATNSPTLSMMASEAGLILGTAAYMSPEQARGLPADHRSDVFAFGVVFYEVLTGRQSFRGDTVPDVLASVLARDVDLSLLPSDLNPRLHELVARCLHKHPKKRWQAIGDVRLELESLADSPRATPAMSLDRPKNFWRTAALPLAASAVIGGVLVGAAMWMLTGNRQRPVAGVTSFSIADLLFAPGTGARTLATTPLAAISPDGRRIVYHPLAGSDGPALYSRRLDQTSSAPIPGTEGGQSPFFSPDGEWLGFFADGKLKKLNLTGGRSVILCDAQPGAGAAWAPDDSIVFATTSVGVGLSIVPAAGGAPRPLTTFAPNERSHRWPIILPGGDRAIFVAAPAVGQPGTIDSVDLKSGSRTVVLPDLTPEAQGVHFAHTGHLVYSQGDSLFAIEFDAQTLKPRGQPIPVLGGIARLSSQVAAQFALSSTGTLVYVPDLVRSERTLAWIDRRGQTESVPLPPHFYARPRLSPDGQSVAVVMTNEGNDAVTGGDVWIGDLKRGTLRRLTRTGSSRFTAQWTPDGNAITLTSAADSHVRQQPVDGSGPAQSLFEPGRFVPVGGWAPDGRHLVVGLAGDIAVWSRDNSSVQQLKTPSLENHARLSPDGRWVAFTSEETNSVTSEAQDIYVQPFPGPGPRTQVSVGTGAFPSWGPAGQIYYVKAVRTEEGRLADAMMAVEMRGSSPTVSVPAPRELFRVDLRKMQLRARDGANYDVSRDGERFLVVREEGEVGTQQLQVVVNWAAQLPSKVRD